MIFQCDLNQAEPKGLIECQVISKKLPDKIHAETSSLRDFKNFCLIIY